MICGGIDGLHSRLQLVGSIPLPCTLGTSPEWGLGRIATHQPAQEWCLAVGGGLPL